MLSLDLVRAFARLLENNVSNYYVEKVHIQTLARTDPQRERTTFQHVYKRGPRYQHHGKQPNSRDGDGRYYEVDAVQAEANKMPAEEIMQHDVYEPAVITNGEHND